jgi:hypothetical protein
MLSRLVPTVAVLAAGIAAVQAADAYQFEGTLGYSTSTADQSDSETTSIRLDGAWFFQAVALDDLPFEEADFLGHHSYIAGYSENPWQSSERQLLSRDTFEVGAIDADGFTYGVSGQWADNESPFTVGAGVITGSVEDSDVDFEVEPLSWTVNVGYWVQKNVVVGARYTADDVEVSGAVSSETETRTIEVFGKGVQQFADHQAINVEASAGQESTDDGSTDLDSWVGVLVVDWYPQPRYGIGIEVGGLRGDDDANEGFTYGVRGSAWFCNYFGVRAGLRQFAVRDDTLGEDDVEWYLELSGRF